MMGPIIAAAIIAWLLTSAIDRAKTEYGHERDRHLKNIQKDHPDWSPRRQQRLAKHRARGYWAHEIGNGFPTMRSAFRENRELARVERAEAEAAGAKRWAEYRQRLEAARAEREKYVTDQVKKDPATDKAAARKAWFDRHKLAGALRAGATATKLELGDTGRRPAADTAVPEPPVADPPKTDAPAKPAAEKSNNRPLRPDTATRRANPTRPVGRCFTCGDLAVPGSYFCAACAELIPLEKRIDGLKRHRNASAGAERDLKNAEIDQAQQRLTEMERAADARRAANGLRPQPVAERKDDPAHAGDTHPAAAQPVCQRGGRPADKLYPVVEPDGTMRAVCSTCAEGGNCGADRPLTRPCSGCGQSYGGVFDLARQPDGRLLCGTCAPVEAAKPGSPGDQADPVYASDEPGTTDSSPNQGGAEQDTNTTGGNPVEAPNIETARANAISVATQIGTVAAGCEQMEADLLAGGLGNDPAALQKFAAAKEALMTAQAAFGEFVNELNKHAAGEEYANTGHAAKTEFLQHA